MLFLLTGEVQTGKTRWLEHCAAELQRGGVPVAGVVAPGVWRERLPGDPTDGEQGLSGKGPFEKLGIDNVLLPTGERVPFARRRDLAQAEGSFNPSSQSAAAQLAWEIADDAIVRVNAHFSRIARAEAVPGACRQSDDLTQAQPQPHRGIASGARFSDSQGFGGGASSRAGLLVVDELGRLELTCQGGLTEAVALLEAGATARFPHALAVVRDWLCDDAEQRFAAAWGGSARLAPGEAARRTLFEAYGLQ